MSSEDHRPLALEAFEIDLPNGSTGDALVLVALRRRSRILLFDAGDPSRLQRREVLRLDHLFVSHCHVDHFIGFDALVRPRVCSSQQLEAHGPPGFLERVESRLRGYDWNLMDGNHFVILAREVGEEAVSKARFDSGAGFRREDLEPEPRSDVFLECDDFRVRTTALDHHLVCHAWALEARPRIHVRMERVRERGLEGGPWLKQLKESVASGADPDRVLETPDPARRTLGELAADFLDVERGERIAYVTDTLWSDRTRQRMVALARDADVLACESPFLEEDGDKARASRHLTARQAGRLAREAGARILLLFHVSDRYGGHVERHVEEAREAAGDQVEVVTLPARPVA